MNLKVIFKNYWILLLTTLVMFFWLGFFCSENLYNQNTTTYSIVLESDKININGINVDFFLKALEKVDDKGNITYSYASVKPKEFFKESMCLSVSSTFGQILWPANLSMEILQSILPIQVIV